MHRTHLEQLRQYMRKHHLDAFYVTDLVHVRYLTGFSGSHGACLIFRNAQYFFTDKRYKEQAPLEVQNFKIVIAPNQILHTIAEKKLLRPSLRVGYEGSALTVEEFAALKKTFPHCSFRKTTAVLETISAHKQPYELEYIRKAASITDEVFKKILPQLKPGVTECDIAAEISYWHRRLGAEGDAFEPIVASGPRGALPHARASEKKLRSGEMVVLDFGCRYRGYHSDLTRTVALGNPPREMKKIYSIVLDAQARALEALAIGREAKAVDAVARSYIRAAGYGKYFIHSLGHGLGIRIHEPLRLSKLSTDVLQEGHVFTVEPGIYLPNQGGVRIEDDVALHNGSFEVLTQSPKEYLSV
ncbi:MAG: aminopeptidase P family protein [Bacteroidetes bacterium]|nr:aminopeptidase P family protein [Bacteroidota bacterium]